MLFFILFHAPPKLSLRHRAERLRSRLIRGTAPCGCRFLCFHQPSRSERARHGHVELQRPSEVPHRWQMPHQVGAMKSQTFHRLMFSFDFGQERCPTSADNSNIHRDAVGCSNHGPKHIPCLDDGVPAVINVVYLRDLILCFLSRKNEDVLKLEARTRMDECRSLPCAHRYFPALSGSVVESLSVATRRYSRPNRPRPLAAAASDVVSVFSSPAAISPIVGSWARRIPTLATALSASSENGPLHRLRFRHRRTIYCRLRQHQLCQWPPVRTANGLVGISSA